MTDFECLLQILGADAHQDIKEYMMYLLKEEMKDAFQEGWIFPLYEFQEMIRDIWEEIHDELKRKYKKQLKGKMEQKILEIIERGDEVYEDSDTGAV